MLTGWWFVVLLCGEALGLYEDQVFKFDWRRQYVGKVEELKFYGTEQDPILIVGTPKNVIAALDSDNGRILWRHKFEEDPAVGRLRRLAVLGRHVATVSGAGPLFLRMWDPIKGALLQEHLVRVKKNPDLIHLSRSLSKMWTINYTPEGVQITSYYFDTKRLGDPTTTNLIAPATAERRRVSKCVVGKGEMLVCFCSTGLLYAPLKNNNGGNTGGSETEQQLTYLAYPENTRLVNLDSVTVRASNLQFENEQGELLTYRVDAEGVEELTGSGSGRLSECAGLEVEQDCVEKGLDSQGVGYCAKYSREIRFTYKQKLQQVVKISEDRGKLDQIWSDCSDLDNSEDAAFQLILGFDDGALVSVTPRGNIMFTREEGLAAIQQVQLVSMAGGAAASVRLPSAASLDSLFDPASLLANFVGRLARHAAQLRQFVVKLVKGLTNNKPYNKQASSSASTSDRFGLNKIIVVVTEHSKLYGLESMSGRIVWQARFMGHYDSTVPAHQPQTTLLVQKDGRAGDYAQAVLVYRHARSVHYLLTFDPLTGRVISDEPLPMHPDQALLLPELAAEHGGGELKPVLIIGKTGQARVYPANAADCLARAGLPLFVVSRPEPDRLTGNKVVIQPSTDSDVTSASSEIRLVPVWTLVSPNTEILSINGRHYEERIHSAGRVLADRSVLFKYMNPNLALVVARGTDSTAKIFINVYLVDLVTGRIFYSASHKKVLPPFHAVHSENWAVYSFFNDKARRTELISLELYEGKAQSNASVFSSVEDRVSPLVERQAYILPITDVTALRETVTEQGITSKNLLIASHQGALIDLPLHMVDPRRPPLDAHAHMREPGIPPYIPELAIMHESILNYNQTLQGVRNIVTSPSGLESTTLVFVYGLDLYGTRVTPSKGFDLIKEDFDYVMITSVIAGLAVASYVTRKFAQKKMLSQAWR